MSLEPAIPAEALAAIRAPFLEAKASLVSAPVMQPLGLVLDLVGEAMRERLFVVQSEGGAEMCLRPDFTIPVARLHIDSGERAGRYTYEGSAFRAAPRGETQAEEFLQVGLEIYGEGDAAALDAEVAALAWRAAAAGGRDDLTLELGDAGLFPAFVDSFDLPAPQAARLKRAMASPRLLEAELEGAAPPRRDFSRLAVVLSGLGEDEAVAVLQEIWTLAGIEPVGGRKPAEIVRRLAERADQSHAEPFSDAVRAAARAFLAVSGPPTAALEQVLSLAGPAQSALAARREAWAARIALLQAQGAPLAAMTFHTAPDQAFGYYDGFMFQIGGPSLGGARIAAGGRYDGLLPRLGGAGGGAVGCMVRPARAYAGAAR